VAQMMFSVVHSINEINELSIQQEIMTFTFYLLGFHGKHGMLKTLMYIIGDLFVKCHGVRTLQNTSTKTGKTKSE
jgi:hypothetical protein